MHWKADLGGLTATIEYSSKNKKLNGYRAVAPLVVARWTTMVIQFDTTELRSLCEDETLATQKLGSDARLLIARLADLISAPSLGELPPGIAHPVEGLTDRYRIEIGAYWLVFVPNHKDPLIGEDGALETRKVTRLKVIAIDHD